MRVAWLRSTVLRYWVTEAEMHYPLETGGVLIGYWADAAAAVVTHAVGAGPRSVHRHDSYDHDHEWEAVADRAALRAITRIANLSRRLAHSSRLQIR